MNNIADLMRNYLSNETLNSLMIIKLLGKSLEEFHVCSYVNHFSDWDIVT